MKSESKSIRSTAKSPAKPAAKSAGKAVRKTTANPVARRRVARTAKSASRGPGVVRQPKRVIPPELLAGDVPVVPAASGPGKRYALGPGAAPEHASRMDERGELPESYGTERLWLAARDPQWLYAAWDFTAEQLKAHNARSATGHLALRVFLDEVGAEPLLTQAVHPESRNWFLHVGRGGRKYLAQLGYLDRHDAWHTVATSGATMTPPESLSDDNVVEFATLPVDVPFAQLLELVKATISEQVPLMEALAQLRMAGHANLPESKFLKSRPPIPTGRAETPPWTPAQEQALAEVVTMDQVRRVWMGSMEITELIRRRLVSELASQSAAQFSAPGSAAGAGAVSSLSRALTGAQPARAFWFNVSAELIIYGGTEPDAQVTIGGRAIRLRPDGTFSYRFALPDGEYELPAVATSAAGDDRRSATLRFRRQTSYEGGVGTQPLDASLRPPRAENVA